ncbi:MAG: hypothetical protein NC485_11705 [Ruminococcus flavefaciens]|nr:hypothetical protein [Ruminococcus flavefaciens]MCM1060868.1 hypothetical protein [Eubacterium sp.]
MTSQLSIDEKIMLLSTHQHGVERLGQFSNDCPYDEISKDIVDNEEARRINLRVSLEQVVLLKNNGIGHS